MTVMKQSYQVITLALFNLEAITKKVDLTITAKALIYIPTNPKNQVTL